MKELKNLILRKAAYFALAAFMALSFVACNVATKNASPEPSPQQIQNEDDGLSAELKDKIHMSIPLRADSRNTVTVGKIVCIVLDEKQSLPNRWKPYISDENKVKLIYDKGRITSGNGMPGGDNGEHSFYFETVEQGECTIEMRLEYVGDSTDYYSSYYTVNIEPSATPTEPAA